MNKTAWLITHDNYIDRRIFFFADVLEKNGYKVTLFPSYYFDLLSDRDPVYVSRPVDESIVKRYGIPYEELSEELRDCIIIIRERQDGFYSRKQRYADSLRELATPMKNKNAGIKVKGFKTFYTIEYTINQVCYVYSSLTDEVKEIHLNHLSGDSLIYERAILEYMTKHAEFDGQAYSVGSINVRSEINEFGEKVYYAQNPACNYMMAYNQDCNVLSKVTAIPTGYYGPDKVKDKTFDFSEYKEIVYEFSPILTNVNRHLECETPDVVYVADLPTLPIGVMLKETTNCKLIIDCHEWWFKQAALWEKDFKRKIELSEFYEKELYPKCDICITVGKYLAKDMAKCYEKNFETIYSCMSADLCVKDTDYDHEIWNRMFGIPLEAEIAVFQGSMTTLRNLDNLARATRYLKDNQYLVIVGGGPYEAEFRKILSAEGKPEQVKFVGWVNQKELMKYTVNADLGVLPYSAMDEYFSYSVPNKLMEYFEATMPMLYDISMKEITMVAGENGVGIGADLSNAEIFGKKMSELLHSPDELKRMRENYSKCKDKFRYVNQEKEFERILQNVMIKVKFNEEDK